MLSSFLWQFLFKFTLESETFTVFLERTDVKLLSQPVLCQSSSSGQNVTCMWFIFRKYWKTPSSCELHCLDLTGITASHCSFYPPLGSSFFIYVLVLIVARHPSDNKLQGMKLLPLCGVNHCSSVLPPGCMRSACRVKQFAASYIDIKSQIHKSTVPLGTFAC